MASIPDLPRVIRLLARLDDEGLLSDYECEVAMATRGPSDDLQKYPHFKFCVGKYARVASRIFGLPIGECHAAACDALLPETRRGIALEILEDFEARLEQQSIEDAAERRIQFERRRLRRA
jgi:hypothetical protein